MSNEIIEVPADEKTTAVVNWEARLAGYAQEAAAEESVSGTWMSLKAGRLTIDKTPVAGNKLDCVVIANARENAYYVGKYDPSAPKPPVCYAIQPIVNSSTNEDDMRPHPKAAEPQSEFCSSCPRNQWGSGDGGKGKACKNVRRLALLPLEAAQNAARTTAADVLYMKLPVMSVKNWSKYVNDVASIAKRPPFAVVTQISTEPDPKSQFKVTFQLGYKVAEPEVLNALVERHERELTTIDFPYSTPSVEAPEAESDKF
jgi:hypothetical protein